MSLRTYLALLFGMLGCVLTHTNAEYRMVGGSDQNFVGSPSLVLIYYDGAHHCVGSLVTLKKLVTTASCVAGLAMRLFVVAAGVTNLCNIPGHGKLRNVESVAYPSGYSRDTKEFNIALLGVFGSFEWSPTIQTIELCSCTFERPTQMRVNRWGRTIEENENSVLTLIEHNDCKSRYEREGGTLTESMICAKHATADVFFIDAGTPGIVDGKLCAVASHNLDCADSGLPTVFTNVTHCDIQDFLIPAIESDGVAAETIITFHNAEPDPDEN